VTYFKSCQCVVQFNEIKPILCVTQNRSKIDPKSIQNRPKIDPISIQCRSKIDQISIQYRSNIDPKSTQNRPNIDPISIQYRPKIDPKSIQNRSNIDPKLIQAIPMRKPCFPLNFIGTLCLCAPRQSPTLDRVVPGPSLCLRRAYLGPSLSHSPASTMLFLELHRYTPSKRPQAITDTASGRPRAAICHMPPQFGTPYFPLSAAARSGAAVADF
jgi:hypothetical protein